MLFLFSELVKGIFYEPAQQFLVIVMPAEGILVHAFLFALSAFNCLKVMWTLNYSLSPKIENKSASSNCLSWQ